MVRRNNRNRKTNNVISQVRRLRNVERPLKVRGRADPPSYVQVPWWQVVISDTVSLNTIANSKSYKGSDIFAIFKAQVANPAEIVFVGKFFSFRITRIDVWETTGKDIGLQVCDFGYALGSGDFIFQGVDAAGRNTWAHLSYIPPKSQQNLVMAGNDDENVFFVDSSHASPTYVVRVHLMWKFRHQTLPNQSLRELLTRLEIQDATNQ